MKVTKVTAVKTLYIEEKNPNSKKRSGIFGLIKYFIIIQIKNVLGFNALDFTIKKNPEIDQQPIGRTKSVNLIKKTKEPTKEKRILMTNLGGGVGRYMGSAAKFLLATKELRGRLVFEMSEWFSRIAQIESAAFQSHIAPRPGTGNQRTHNIPPPSKNKIKIQNIKKMLALNHTIRAIL